MAEKAGKNLLLKIESPVGSGTYATAAGLQAKELSYERDNIEVTNHGSSEWQTFLESAGVRKIQITANGIFTTDSMLAVIRDAVKNGTNLLCKLIDDDGSGTALETYSGSFKVPSLSRAGEYNGAQTWNITLVSNGEITIA